MAPCTARHVFLTGQPGVGKTTLLCGAVKKLVASSPTNNGGLPVANGFYTEECRDQQGERVGFDVVTLDGRRGPLARAGNVKKGQPAVGKYAVGRCKLDPVLKAPWFQRFNL